MRRLPAIVIVALALGGAVGCGQSGPVPGDAVQNYLFTLAEGNYTRACGMLSAAALSTLVRAQHRRHPCAVIYRHCLRSDPQSLGRDQTQLVFDTVQTFPHGRHALAVIRGTAVAAEIQRVTLAQPRRQWILTSPGVALSRCRFFSRSRGGRATERPSGSGSNRRGHARG